MEATTGVLRRRIFSTTALHNLPLIASRMSRQRSERFQFWSTILKSYIWMRRWTRNRLPSFGGTTTFSWKLKTSPRSRRRSQMLWWTSRCNNGLLFPLENIENLIRFYSINVTQYMCLLLKVPWKGWNHLDFLFGMDADKLQNHHILQLLRKNPL